MLKPSARLPGEPVGRGVLLTRAFYQPLEFLYRLTKAYTTAGPS